MVAHHVQHHLLDVGELSAWLTAELSLLETLSDSYLYFEHLAEHNQPFYVTEVADAAAARGLTVFADADPTTELTDPPDATERDALVQVHGPVDQLPVSERAGVGGGQAEVQRNAQLLDLFSRGQIQVSWWQAPIAAAVGERPLAFALARRQAASNAPMVTTLLHERFGVDTLDRVLLEHLDGGHDRSALHARVRAAQRSGRLVMSVEEEPVEDPELITALVEHKLQRLWHHGLLVDG